MPSQTSQTFGVMAGTNVLDFVANYKGPLVPFRVSSATNMDLAATHEDPAATLGLEVSCQVLNFDSSTIPNKVSGEASFLTKDGKDVLLCKFAGIAPPRRANEEFQMAFVHVVFSGGTGRFVHATGTGSVEAELYPQKGFSQGKIVAKVIVP